MANRENIARAVAEKRGISISEALSLIGAVIEVLNETLKKDDVQLSGLGSFRRSTRKARKGRNPRTGEIITIPEKIVVRFRPSKNLLVQPVE